MPKGTLKSVKRLMFREKKIFVGGDGVFFLFCFGLFWFFVCVFLLLFS